MPDLTPIHMMYVFCLDDYHVGDPHFLQSLAREITGSRPNPPRILMVHGSGEAAERALEGQGRFRKRTEGVLAIGSAEEAAIVDRATRQANQKVVDTLTDEIVPAVSVQGDARNLFVHTDSGVQVGSTGWLRDLVENEGVPVISSIARHPQTGGAREVSLAEAVVALAGALDSNDLQIVAFVRSQGRNLFDKRDTPIGVRDLPDEKAIPARDTVVRAVERGQQVLLTTPTFFFGSDSGRGRAVIA